MTGTRVPNYLSAECCPGTGQVTCQDRSDNVSGSPSASPSTCQSNLPPLDCPSHPTSSSTSPEHFTGLNVSNMLLEMQHISTSSIMSADMPYQVISLEKRELIPYVPREHL